MFLKSPKLAGERHLGIIVTYSCFHISGQMWVVVMALYMWVKGMASRVAYLSIKVGKMSPITIDFGFLNALILPST